MDDQRDLREAMERRAREVFDASVESVDEETLARLSRARFAAVAAADRRRRPAWRTWVPVAAVASTVLVAVLLWRSPEPTTAPTDVAANGDVATDPVELLATDDDLDLVQNDLEFYRWLDATDLDVSESTG
jgi:hypothetical protein